MGVIASGAKQSRGIQDGPDLRLLCDEMLLRLGRWLRAAGYDTAIAAGGDDDATLIARCRGEGRILVTCDGRLAVRAAANIPAVRLAADSVGHQARALKAALGIDWQGAPFTRCLVDNVPLDSATPDAAEQVPSRSRAAGGPLRRCPQCGRLYWTGGHVRRMQARLVEWNRT